ncbi:TonB-dependent receptor [Robertkochia sediminum]|uniref:TonB-dependent receptor n=1 Tax=Robertkochia sediminum TaxID=2785326 RepID=UPI0019338513|nr:carboxypeptidase-like regulatory domain-containing protein [Robertkochia sediminum]MBL7472181.1 carboxypeptidase-like regulatory domain-containing protein [Robertkochia sediminum]
MKGSLIIICSLFCFHLSIAQFKSDKISIAFNGVTLAQAFSQLDEVTGYTTYFYPQWFSNDLINKSYREKDLEFILEDLLKDNSINYFIYEPGRIILTKNNSIYDELPEGFFGKEEKAPLAANPANNASPIFYQSSPNLTTVKTETIRIGKEDKANDKKSYILKGRITDAVSGNAIPDMSILTSNNIVLGVTNETGTYSISLSAGRNLLNFRGLGYESDKKEVIIFNDGYLNLSFNESVEQLEEVVVEGDIYSNIEEVSGGSEEVGSEESKTIPLVLGERDVMKVATALPGISTAGEGATGFNVRGGRADQNLILLDGATIYNPQHFFGIFSAINPFSIGKLDVYKGNIPPKYGGRLSSVFDMQIRERDHAKLRGEASVGPVTGNVVLDIPVVKEKSSVMIGGRGAYANWILRQLDDEELQNSSASFYDGVINYAHDIDENNELTATAYYSNDDFSIASDSLFIYNNRLLALRWQHRFNDKHVGELQVTNSNYGFNIEYERGANNDFDLGFNMNESTAKFNFNYLNNSGWSLNYGLEGKWYVSEPGSIKPLNAESAVQTTSLQQEKALEGAGYASVNYDLTKKLSVDAGLRFSVFSALGERTQFQYLEGNPRNRANITDTLNYGKNEPIKTYGGPEVRAGIRYLITPSFSVKAGYNNAIQYIHMLTNNTTVSPIDTWKLSDLNIEPQRGQQFSFGLFKNIDADAYEISLEGFYKTSTNVLDFKTGADLLLNENVESEVLQGDGRSYGVEFLIRKNKGRLNGWLGYTYSRSLLRLDSEFEEERVNDGEYFPSNFDKPHDLSMVANYKFTRRFSFSANFIYQTGRPVTVPVGNISFNGAQYAVYSDRNSFRIPDFYRLDLAFNIEGNHKLKKAAHSFWSLSIYNALGRNNPYSVFYVTDSGEVEAYKSSIFAIPVPSITYNIKF